jgi:acyl-[acyl-carrier-protein]-phospholipid O-acyltransferase/long-chain-fatty-acid--[acyl-carrier-protein] ligase
MLSRLMSARRFAPLFWSQFCSALNDNFLKNALGMLLLFGFGATAATDKDTAALLNTLAGVALIAPFFFLSALGGELADKFDKGHVASRVKLAEIPVAVLAAIGFYYHSVPVIFAALTGFGIMGALFGPVKYGILPEALKTEELSAGNALVEGATFMAILLGTIGGGLAVTEAKSPELICGVMVVLSLVCWLAARMIPHTGPAAPNIPITKNPLASTFRLLSELKSDPRLRQGSHFCSAFWLIGVVSMALLPVLVTRALGGAPAVYTYALSVFVVGIATGSLMAAGASHDRPNLALVPLGGVLMGIAATGLAVLAYFVVRPTADVQLADFLFSRRGLAMSGFLFLLAMGGGLFIVPAFAIVQSWAPPDRRARIVAAVNVSNAAYMTLGGIGLAGLQALEVPVWSLFAIVAALAFSLAGLVAKLWGQEGVRGLGRGIFQLAYDLEVHGLEHLPKAGEPTIIAPNHVSFLEAPMLHSILPGHAAFAVDSGIAKVWWIKPFLRFVKYYALDPTKPLATRSLVNTVKSGQSVVIFPEGRATVTGQLMKAYDGAGMIADRSGGWVVPVRVSGAERARFWSYLRSTQIKKVLFPKVTLTFLPPRKLTLDPALKGKTRRMAAGRLLQDMLTETAVATAPTNQTLFEAIAETGRIRTTAKIAIQDPMGTKLSVKKLILGAQVLGLKLERLAPIGGAVGVMLPNSAGVAVVITALSGIGRVPAMINFTAGAANIRAACTAAKVETILTSRAFIEKGRLERLIADLEAQALTFIYSEDIRASIGAGDKIKGLIAGDRPRVRRAPDDPAAILFTSGSEGVPKGVVLSHRNILTNVWQCLSQVDANGEDKVFNALPVFHCFGLVAGLLMPLIGGIPIYMYPTPLHYRIIPELVYDSQATILFGTDTFLNGYARVAHPYDLRSVRFIMAGAEAVKDRTRQLYSERFGVRILEGYGVTETAPVLALNSLIANRAGTVGRLAPLMQSRLEPVPGIDEGGRLHVKGPNVMLGYLRVENPGVLEVPPEGWHDTGDIVSIDTEGFITIRGRAKRFAKIAGEMVSLSVVEAIASVAFPNVTCIAVAQPDARKGERVVLLTTDGKAKREDFQRAAKAKGASELSTPAEIIVVEKLPLLGSGKPDYVAASALAKSRATHQVDGHDAQTITAPHRASETV